MCYFNLCESESMMWLVSCYRVYNAVAWRRVLTAVRSIGQSHGVHGLQWLRVQRHCQVLLLLPTVQSWRDIRSRSPSAPVAAARARHAPTRRSWRPRVPSSGRREWRGRQRRDDRARRRRLRRVSGRYGGRTALLRQVSVSRTGACCRLLPANDRSGRQLDMCWPRSVLWTIEPFYHHYYLRQMQQIWSTSKITYVA